MPEAVVKRAAPNAFFDQMHDTIIELGDECERGTADVDVSSDQHKHIMLCDYLDSLSLPIQDLAQQIMVFLRTWTSCIHDIFQQYEDTLKCRLQGEFNEPQIRAN